MTDYMDALESALTAASAALYFPICEGNKNEKSLVNAAYFNARLALWAAKSRQLNMDLDLYKMIANHDYESMNTKESLAMMKVCMQDKRVHQFVAEQAPSSIVDLIHRVILRGKPFVIDTNKLPASQVEYMTRLHANV